MFESQQKKTSEKLRGEAAFNEKKAVLAEGIETLQKVQDAAVRYFSALRMEQELVRDAKMLAEDLPWATSGRRYREISGWIDLLEEYSRAARDERSKIERTSMLEVATSTYAPQVLPLILSNFPEAREAMLNAFLDAAQKPAVKAVLSSVVEQAKTPKSPGLIS